MQTQYSITKSIIGRWLSYHKIPVICRSHQLNSSTYKVDAGQSHNVIFTVYTDGTVSANLMLDGAVCGWATTLSGVIELVKRLELAL